MFEIVILHNNYRQFIKYLPFLYDKRKLCKEVMHKILRYKLSTFGISRNSKLLMLSNLQDIILKGSSDPAFLFLKLQTILVLTNFQPNRMQSLDQENSTKLPGFKILKLSNGSSIPLCGSHKQHSLNDVITPLYVQLLAAEVYLIRMGNGRLRVSVRAILSTTKETGYYEEERHGYQKNIARNRL